LKDGLKEVDLIQTEIKEKVIVLKFSRGVTNAINLSLVKELSESIKRATESKDIQGIVLTGSNNKFFSIGFDIPGLYDLSKEDFSVFYKSFNKVCIDLYTVPIPTIVAITGHATAGGCILALCCDYRFISKGRKLMGMNEIKLGVPIPYPVDCILRQTVDAYTALEIVSTGDFFLPDVLLRMGMVDEVLPLEEVFPKSIEKVKVLGKSLSESYGMNKQKRVEPVKAEILEYLEEKEERFINLWYSENVRELLKAAMEKFTK
jgi:enoyl-CoA hydratase/carnithine racemase